MRTTRTASATATAPRRRPVAVLPLLATVVLTGCGFIGGPTEYGTQERTITVDKGDEFTLKVPASSAMGENWYLAEPKPEEDVLDHGGKREDNDAGDDGEEYFDFTAVKSGKATVKLLHCPNGLCHSEADAKARTPSLGAPDPTPIPTSTGTPQERVEYYLYEITVR
ncbi:protease inhibitor I42 family protein [Streptomyces sp. NPDC050433]|uniref:protease inhibitor I42 family protein n=1 Tax=unclassified Streptomyces TaxID=2593676 RepID=UPI00342D6794